MARVDVYERAELTVGGSPRTVLELTATHGIRSPFATLSSRVRHTEGGFTGNEDVRAALGYRPQSSVRPVFGGRIKGDTIRWAPKTVGFTATGPLALTQEATGIVDDSLANNDPELPPDYDRATYALGWADATDGEIIADILALYGITDVNIEDTGRDFATLAPDPASRWAVKLASDQPGWDLIQEIDTLTGCRTLDGPDGRVTRVRASGRPSGGAARTYTEGVDFKGTDAFREKSTEGLCNKIVVDGQSGIDPDGVPYSIHSERSAPSPFIPNPPGTRVFPLQSQLIETQGFADDVRDLLLEEKNWRRENVTLPLSYGDSSIHAGMTVAIDAPESLDLTDASRWRIIEVRHTFGGQGFQTTIVCEGAEDASAQGTAPNQRPVPLIAYELLFEGLANGDIACDAALDGSASFDPDGTIVSYVWDGDPVVPTPIGDGRRAVAVYNPLPDSPPPTVSLTVTDNLGLTATAERAIVAGAGNAYTRELWVAEGDQLAYTEDQVVWEEYPVAAVVIPEEAGDEAILAAEADGTLHRVELDGTDTTPSGPEDVTALSMTRDRNGRPTGVCWAGASDGRAWRSVDGGVSWVEVAPLPNGERCNALAESPYQGGDVYAGGGNVLYHSFDAGASWQPFYTHANAAYVLTRFASGITAADESAMWLGFSGPDLATEPRVVERAGVLAHDFPALTGAPRDITGLTISLDAARIFVIDSGGRAWTATTDGSEDLTPAPAYDDGDLGDPRHAIRDGRFPVVWGAGGLVTWKSTDEGGSYLIVREREAHMVAYGRLRPATIVVTDAIVSAAGAELVHWALGVFAPPTNFDDPAFDDSAWAPASLGSYGIFATVPGADPITDAAPHGGSDDGTLSSRRVFDGPAATPTAATMTINGDDVITAIFLNETNLTANFTRPFPLHGSVTFPIDPALLLVGAPNLLAVASRNQGGTNVMIAYRLEWSS